MINIEIKKAAAKDIKKIKVYDSKIICEFLINLKFLYHLDLL